MNISSVVIRTRPESLAAVRERLAALPGVELHTEAPDGRLVVTVEDTNVATAAETYLGLHNIDGVLGASLVYQYSDDGLEPQELQERQESQS
jgi:nitrate reductase NapD